MFAKLFNIPLFNQQRPLEARVSQADLDPRICFHYGNPSNASILALDRTQSLLAIGTLDGRIKVIGGDNIEGLLVSPKPFAFKYLEFLENQGFLASVSSENEIQVWDLEHKRIAASLQWECRITAFAVIYGTNYMYIGSEYAMVSLVKFDAEDGKIKLLPYYITSNFIAEAAGMSLPDTLSVVGVLHQPSSPGNRLLIAYENGLIVLWDALQDQVVLVKGSKELPEAISDSKQVEKQISSLCWACDNGSTLVVGYIDGDIMLWDLSASGSSKDKSKNLANNVAKLQLSTDENRLPVIVLRWSANRSSNHLRGQLFVYGGRGIGSEEVITVVSVDWSSDIESLKCVGRVDITLVGSFADMVLLPAAGATEDGDLFLFTLTSQGELHVYDKACLSAMMSHLKKKTDEISVQYPVFIPTTEPCMTVAKLASVDRDGKYTSTLSKQVAVGKSNAKNTLNEEGAKWPLTGGIPGVFPDDYHLEKLYVAGYEDGSVRIWDATYPALSFIYAIGPEVEDIMPTGATRTISALEICSRTLTLAIGDVSGLVRLYNLIGNPDQTKVEFVTQKEKKVYTLQQGNGPQCTAVFSILDSPISILQYDNFGARLAVGFECGRVAMLDISTTSFLYLTNTVSNSSSPLIYLYKISFADGSSLSQSPLGSESKNVTDPDHGEGVKDTESETLKKLEDGLVFVMTRNAHIFVLDYSTGNMIRSWPMHPNMESTAVSLYVIEDGDISCDLLSKKQQSSDSPNEGGAELDKVQQNADSGETQLVVEPDTSTKNAHLAQRSMNICVLLCSDIALHFCSLKYGLEGDSNSILKVNLDKPCCWTATFKKDGKHSGLVVLYQTGVFEIRSFPNLEVVRETSLMEILRWNFMTNMDKTFCSYDRGQMIVVKGCEIASVSLLAREDEFRISESIPSLHDKVLAAATDVIANSSHNQNQSSSHGILKGFIKGFKKSKTDENMEPSQATTNHENYCANLEYLFSNPPFLKPSTDVKDSQEPVILTGDIVLEGHVTVMPKDQTTKEEKKDKGAEKKKLLEGASSSSDTLPKPRTAAEIKARYRETGDVAAAAAQARAMLEERQQKLEKLSENTQELANGAEDFASLAKELAKKMENRKWWQL